MKKSAVLILIILSLFYFAEEAQSASGKGSPQFRAIGGVSMGAYGAMNIGLGRPSFFNTIASLGGPLDMAYLLKFIEVDMLGNYDNPSAYPNRGTLLNMLKDLTISFGNPVYYNPISTYYPPGITAQNARVPTTLFNFKDDLNPYGRLPVITFEDPAPGAWVEVLLALDSNRNRKRDLGEPILRRFQEPFTDTNRNAIYDPGEPFGDTGLDGVPGTRDRGEGDRAFTYNPNHDNFFAEDPLSRAYSLSFADLQGLNLYIDAGTEDEFQFDIHADNFVDTLNDRGLAFLIDEDGRTLIARGRAKGIAQRAHLLGREAIARKQDEAEGPHVAEEIALVRRQFGSLTAIDCGACRHSILVNPARLKAPPGYRWRPGP